MSRAYNTPHIERTVFQYALWDKCIKPIYTYESSRNVATSHAKIHPKENLDNAREVVRCLVEKYICLI